MYYGGNNIIGQPNSSEEHEIIRQRREKKRKERLDRSRNSDSVVSNGSDVDIDEEDSKIRNALAWKRRHFFMSSLFVVMMLMLKLELSYESFFSRNILYFLIGFTVLDIFIEELLNRTIMGETLLVSPLLR
jgi:hypothetical protein